MIEQGVNEAMTADPTLSALVGGCIYPVLLPDQATFPCVTYSEVLSAADVNLDGSAERWKRFQIDGWGKNYGDTKSIQAALKHLFEGFVGLLPDGTYVRAAFLDQEIDLFEDQARTYRSLTEFVFHYVDP